MRKSQAPSYIFATMLILFSIGSMGSTTLIQDTMAEAGGPLEFGVSVNETTVGKSADYNLSFTFPESVTGDIILNLTFPTNIGYDFDQISAIQSASVQELDVDEMDRCIDENQASFSQGSEQSDLFVIEVPGSEVDCSQDARIQITIQGINNPELAGNHEFDLEILENEDPLAEPDSASLEFTAAETARLAIEPGDLEDLIAGEEFFVSSQAQDEYGNLNESFVGDISLKLLTTEDQDEDVTNSLQGDTESEAVDGIAEFSSLKITLAGEFFLVAHVSGGSEVEEGETTPFQVAPGAPDLDESSVTADPPSIPADGENSSMISVQLKDEFGNIINGSGEEICLSFDEASDIEGDLLSDAAEQNNCAEGVNAELLENGTYGAIFVSTEVGSATILAALEGELLTDTATVETSEIIPEPSHIVVSSTDDEIPANGEATTEISVRFLDEDQDELAIEDATVCLSTDLGNLSGEQGNCSLGEVQAEYGDDGIYTAELTSSTNAGVSTVVAVSDNLSNMTSVEFRPGPPTALAFDSIPSVEISPVDSFEVQVVILDEFGNLVDNATNEVSITIEDGPGGAELGGLVRADAENGTVIFANLTLDQAGEYILNATAENLTSATSEPFNVHETIDLAGYNHDLQSSVRVLEIEDGMEVTWDTSSYSDIEDWVMGIIVWRINSPAIGIDMIESGSSEYENSTYIDTEGLSNSSYILTLCIWTGEGCDEDLSTSPGYEDQDEEALLATAAGPGTINAESNWIWIVITLAIVVVSVGTVVMFVWASKTPESNRRGPPEPAEHNGP